MSYRDRCAGVQTARAETGIVWMGVRSLPFMDTCSPRPGIGSPRSGPFFESGLTREPAPPRYVENPFRSVR